MLSPVQLMLKKTWFILSVFGEISVIYQPIILPILFLNISNPVGCWKGICGHIYVYVIVRQSQILNR